MIKNYFMVAIRNLIKGRLYTVFNILGLSLGLAIFVFAMFLARYEESHDAFFPNADRIYAVAVHIKPESNIPFHSMPGNFTAMGPLIEAEISGVEKWARLMPREYLVQMGERKFYQFMRFADPAFLDILQLDFVAGNPATALDQPDGAIISESAARKFFGSDDPMGQIITIRRDHSVRVTGVFKNLPLNTHLLSLPFDDERSFDFVTTFEMLNAITETPMEGEWLNMSATNYTYVLLEEGVSAQTVEDQINQVIFDRLTNDSIRNALDSMRLRPLTDINLSLWMALGLPATAVLRLLGFVIILVASLNYVNLATAQMMGRNLEIGIRKVMGASRKAIATQFLLESTLVAFIALFIGMLLLTQAIPVFNSLTGKIFSLDLMGSPSSIAMLFGIVLVTGLISGLYPALVGSRQMPVTVLHQEGQSGKRSAWIRSTMLVIQFAISVFLAITVTVVYRQNALMLDSDSYFERDQIATIARMSRDKIRGEWKTLETQISAIPGVRNYGMSSQLPYDQSFSERRFSKDPVADETGTEFGMIYTSGNFLPTLSIPLTAGRYLDDDRQGDVVQAEEEGVEPQITINVIINEMGARKMGFDNPADAIGQSWHLITERGRTDLTHVIVGVIPDFNYHGFMTSIRPLMFRADPDRYFFAVVDLTGSNIARTTAEMEQVWDRIVPDYPFEQGYVSDIFDDIFSIFRSGYLAIMMIASMAIFVASIGLFGISAYMTRRRTHEVGIRKVLGASVGQITSLLIWQFTRPIIVAMLLGAPLAALAMSEYLGFFAQRVSIDPIILGLTLLALLAISWATVGGHAISAARTRPSSVLRHE